MMIAAIVVGTVGTAVVTLVWWSMMNSWMEKDRKRRGRHFGEPVPPARADASPRVVRTQGATDRPDEPEG